jgi:hypothetical protein
MKKKFLIVLGLFSLMTLTGCSNDDKLDVPESSRGDRYLSHSSRHTQVPVPATTMESLS